MLVKQAQATQLPRATTDDTPPPHAINLPRATSIATCCHQRTPRDQSELGLQRTPCTSSRDNRGSKGERTETRRISDLNHRRAQLQHIRTTTPERKHKS
ncbi:hypothetical protein Bca4012_010868 [Brassica carinata]|uniref:Uncharacterized protein n=1 Tax=Brassica carinata TaxID=52824 RepID=A0A8X7V209_BRACI|nr:hypothetical protein Bca52824_035766 [Brassica carinata]